MTFRHHSIIQSFIRRGRLFSKFLVHLDECGVFHLGEFVNSIQKGLDYTHTHAHTHSINGATLFDSTMFRSLVMATPDADNAIVPTHLFGTVNGAIGVIAPLTKVG